MRMSIGQLIQATGSASFSNSPIRFLDAELEYTLTGQVSDVEREIQYALTSLNAQSFQFSDANISPPNQLIPDQPQWHESAPIGGQGSIYSAAYIANVSGLPLTQFGTDNPPIPGQFRPLTSTVGIILRFVAGITTGIFETTNTIQIATTADLGNVLAQADITLRCTVT